MNSKMKHTDALRNNQRKCAAYRAEGRREANKARRQAKIQRNLAKAAAKRAEAAHQ